MLRDVYKRQIVISDKVKENAKEVISNLKEKNHIKKLVMLRCV